MKHHGDVSGLVTPNVLDRVNTLREHKFDFVEYMENNEPGLATAYKGSPNYAEIMESSFALMLGYELSEQIIMQSPASLCVPGETRILDQLIKELS